MRIKFIDSKIKLFKYNTKIIMKISLVSSLNYEEIFFYLE